MSADVPETFRFGDRRVTVDLNDFYDLLFEAPDEFCDWLLEHEAWRDLGEVCRCFHIDHVAMLGDWAARELAQLPEEIRHPVDGTVRDRSTLLRLLAGACPWMVANDKLNQARWDYDESAPTIAAEEAVRAAARDLIDAALGYPPPYRDGMVQQSMVWADFVDRRWLQGLNIPVPWRWP
jgi:hypothetical protein